jgi:ABC-type phosphate transport system substrate-binding protein
MVTGVTSTTRAAVGVGKQAVNTVAKVPTNIVNMSTGLFADITEQGPPTLSLKLDDQQWDDDGGSKEDPSIALAARRQQSMMTFEQLRHRSALAKADAVAKRTSRFLVFFWGVI